jgi:predicted RNase H-like nuclease
VRVLGVDGCRGGWLAVTVDGAAVVWRWTTDVRELLDDDTLDAIAIDIPIGLPDAGGRACDRAARARLGRRGSTVFAAPVRAVLDCVTYADARAVLAERGGPSMSAQAFGIVRAVRAVDRALTPADETRVLEAHPELAFAAMTAGCRSASTPPLASKKSAPGAAARLSLLSGWLPTVLAALSDCPASAPIDDAFDALACAWVAQRWVSGDAEVFGDGARDTRGLVMQIVA